MTKVLCAFRLQFLQQMRLKPSVIKQLAEMEQGGLGGDKKETMPLFVEGLRRLISDEDDEVFLEDEVQRICLRSDEPLLFSTGALPTGVVVAIRGLESDSTQGTRWGLEGL